GDDADAELAPESADAFELDGVGGAPGGEDGVGLGAIGGQLDGELADAAGGEDEAFGAAAFAPAGGGHEDEPGAQQGEDEQRRPGAQAPQGNDEHGQELGEEHAHDDEADPDDAAPPRPAGSGGGDPLQLEAARGVGRAALGAQAFDRQALELVLAGDADGV